MFPAVLLCLLVVVYRVAAGVYGHHEMAWLHNFSPLPAVVLCGAAFFARPWAWVLPLGTLLVSDVALNWHYGHGSFSFLIYLTLALVWLLGWTQRSHPRAWSMLGMSVVSSLLFYIITNTAAWLEIAQYARTPDGWLQALTTGLPGLPPTWLFFRNSLVSGLLFTGLFLLAMQWGRRSALTSAGETTYPAGAVRTPLP